MWVTGDSQASVSNLAILPLSEEPTICRLLSSIMIVLLVMVCAVSLPISVDVNEPLGSENVRIPAPVVTFEISNFARLSGSDRQRGKN